MDKREILQKALENINHPLSEITRRTTYRGHSPGVKPTTGIKLNLPKTSTMAAKMERVLADKSPEGRKRMKQMNNLVIGREEDGDKISLEFKTTASRERFRKMMNELSENVNLDEMKKSDGPFTVVALKGKKVVGQLRNVEHYDIEVAIDMMRKDKQGAKISVESKSGKVVHTEGVQLDEGSEIEFKFKNPMKAGAFMRRIMRDKLASEVDRYDGERSPEEIVQVIMHPNDYERNDIERLAKQYKGQLRETNFRFPQPGEDYGDLTKSISDDPYYTMSKAELRKRSRDIERKFASVMRKHKRTKVGEVLDLLDKDGGTKLYKDSDIKQIGKYLTKFKDNVRKVAHQMLIDVMEGDDYLAKKRIPVKEDVQIKEAESLRWTSMKDTEKEELVRLAKVPARVTEMKWKEIPNPLKERLAKYINKSTKGEFALVEERSHTIVVDRKTGKTVYGPTDVADAKLYVKKQIQPNKFVIRQIRGGQIYR